MTALVLWPLLRAYDAAFPDARGTGRVSSEGAEDRGRSLAVVFLDGDYGDPGWYRALVSRAGLVLAADGGARFLAGLGVTPDAVVGDFDSLDEAVVRRLEDDGVELVRHPVRKDVTDGELAVDEALRRGADEVVLAGRDRCARPHARPPRDPAPPDGARRGRAPRGAGPLA